MQVLYLPKPGVAESHDLVRQALIRRFLVDDAASFEDAESILTLQCRNRAYDYDALVIGTEPAGRFVEIMKIRQNVPAIPIVTLTSQKSVSKIRTRLLHIGADDCLPVRHVSAEELEATIFRRILARYERRSYMVEVGNTVIDLANKTAAVDTQQCFFTPVEWLIVELLAIRSPRTVYKDSFRTMLSGPNGSNVLEVMISKVRGKFRLLDSNLRIQSVRGTGYLLTT